MLFFPRLIYLNSTLFINPLKLVILFDYKSTFFNYLILFKSSISVNSLLFNLISESSSIFLSLYSIFNYYNEQIIFCIKKINLNIIFIKYFIKYYLIIFYDFITEFVFFLTIKIK
jgi:hypothetical protein